MSHHAPSYAEIHGILRAVDWRELPTLRLTILRNITVEGIEPYLRYFGWREQHQLDLRFGGFDSLMSEALGGDASLLSDALQGVLVFARLEGLSWDLARNFASLTQNQVEVEQTRILEQVALLLRGIREQTSAPVLWYGFERSLHPAMGAADAQTVPSQIRTILDLDREVMRLLSEVGGAYWIDTDTCLARVGAEAFYDQRYWHIGRAPFANEALRELASEAFRLLRASLGRNKKCLVLDCDNTLWGGVLGEVGPAGIKLGRDYPGSPYFELQQEIRNLYSRGVILALCSKNNEDDVWDVFRNHPDMLLREQHISASRINWTDKASNLLALAEELSIGLDSMVLMDDSEFETSLVSRLLPEISVLHLPPESSVAYRDILAGCGLFDALTVSDEDRRRGDMYRAETRRKRLRGSLRGLDEYLRSLGMELEFASVGALEAPRVAQLCQRTNQFNLTLRRHSESDVAALTESETADVVAVRLKDCFGDAGVVGAFILRYCASKASIDTFLLSCRVLGRRVEDAMLAVCVELALRRGCSTVEGEYVPGKKNRQVSGFYPAAGFDPSSDGGGAIHYVREAESLPVPDVFESVNGP